MIHNSKEPNGLNQNGKDNFFFDTEYKESIEELKDLYLDGHCTDGGVIQLTINDIMTNFENKNKLENKFAKRYEKISLWRDMHLKMSTFKSIDGEEDL